MVELVLVVLVMLVMLVMLVVVVASVVGLVGSVVVGSGAREVEVEASSAVAYVAFRSCVRMPSCSRVLGMVETNCCLVPV